MADAMFELGANQNSTIALDPEVGKYQSSEPAEWNFKFGANL